MNERRKAKFKQGINLRGTSDRLKQQFADGRAGKRSELIKRFRGGNDCPDNNDNETFSAEALHEIVIAIKNMDMTMLVETVSTLRHFLCSDDPPIQAVVDSGLIEDLIRILSYSNEALTPNVVWCLSNIATGNHQQTGAVMHALPALLNIIKADHTAAENSVQSASLTLQEDACRVIGNIAGDSDEYRLALLQCSALQPIVDILQRSLIRWREAASKSSALEAEAHLSSTSTAIWTVTNMARGTTSGDLFLKSGVTTSLIEALQMDLMGSSGSQKVLTEVNWLFAFLTAKEDATVLALMDQGLVEAFVTATCRADAHCMGSVPCVRVLVNLSSLLEGQDRLLRLPSLLPALPRLCDISSAHKAVVKESLLLLCQLLSEERPRQFVLQTPSAASLLHCVGSALLSDVFEVQREAVFALHSACLDPNVAVCAAFSSEAVLRQVMHLLQAPDAEVCMCSLEVLRLVATQSSTTSTLEGLGLYDVLDGIQYGPGDADIRRAARTLAENLFEKEDEEDQLADPGTTGPPNGLGGGITFGSPSTGGGSVGRGSHLARPAWMTPN